MHIVDDYLTRNHSCKLAVYDSLNDFALRLLNCDRNAQAYLDSNRGRYEVEWAGGTEQDTIRGCRGENLSYAERADKYVTQFGNVGLQAQAIDMEHNAEHGALDVGAWLSGEPEHLYGPALTHTDRAPIAITLDQWIWAGCEQHAIERRGVSAMALAQALSMYRPVMLYVVIAHRHTPSDTNAVQVIPAPSNPMDTARCAFMMAATCFVRMGMMPMLYQIAQSPRPCGIPPTTAGVRWQQEKFGTWLAPRLGVDEDNIVHLPMMLDEQEFGNDASAMEWVKRNVAKYS